MRIAFQHAFAKDDQLLFYTFLIQLSDGDINNNWLIIRNNYLISLKNNNMTQFEIKLNDDPVGESDGDEGRDNYIQTHIHNYTAHTGFTVASELTSFNKFQYVLDVVFNLNFTASFECDVIGRNSDPSNKMSGRLDSQVIELEFEVSNEQENSIFTKISKFSWILSFIGLLQLFNFKCLADKFVDNENKALKVKDLFII